MKEKRILDALNDIDERYIADAAPGKRRSPKKPLYTRLVTAAALVLLLTGALFWMRGRFDPPSGEAVTQALSKTTAAGLPETWAPEIVPETAAAETIREETANDAMEPDPPVQETERTPDVIAGDPCRKLLSRYGLPENCVALKAASGEDEAEHLITDPAVMAQILELLAPCRCTDAADQAENEEGPLTILIRMKDETTLTISLYDRIFSCDGRYFEIPKKQRETLLQYFGPK